MLETRANPAITSAPVSRRKKFDESLTLISPRPAAGEFPAVPAPSNSRGRFSPPREELLPAKARQSEARDIWSTKVNGNIGRTNLRGTQKRGKSMGWCGSLREGRHVYNAQRNADEVPKQEGVAISGSPCHGLSSVPPIARHHADFSCPDAVRAVVGEIIPLEREDERTLAMRYSNSMRI